MTAQLFAFPAPEERPAKKRKRSLVPQTSAIFDEAWAVYPPSGRARQSRSEAYPVWKEIASEVGEDLLLACVKRYALEDKDHKRDCGAPGFERWLKWGRWDNWRPVDAVVQVMASENRFPDDFIRNAFTRSQAHGEGWCVSYLDRCSFIDDVVVTTSATAFAKLSREPMFRELGVIVELKSI